MWPKSPYHTLNKIKTKNAETLPPKLDYRLPNEFVFRRFLFPLFVPESIYDKEFSINLINIIFGKCSLYYSVFFFHNFRHTRTIKNKIRIQNAIIIVLFMVSVMLMPLLMLTTPNISYLNILFM